EINVNRACRAALLKPGSAHCLSGWTVRWIVRTATYAVASAVAIAHHDATSGDATMIWPGITERPWNYLRAGHDGEVVVPREVSLGGGDKSAYHSLAARHQRIAARERRCRVPVAAKRELASAGEASGRRIKDLKFWRRLKHGAGDTTELVTKIALVQYPSAPTGDQHRAVTANGRRVACARRRQPAGHRKTAAAGGIELRGGEELTARAVTTRDEYSSPRPERRRKFRPGIQHPSGRSKRSQLGVVDLGGSKI